MNQPLPRTCYYLTNPSLGHAAQTTEAGDVGPWEPHAKTEAPAVSLVRTHSRPSPAASSDVRFRLASGFEARPVNHYFGPLENNGMRYIGGEYQRLYVPVTCGS